MIPFQCKIFFTALIVASCVNLNAQKLEKKLENSFNVNCNTVLNVSHLFGELKIVPHNKQTIDIVAVIIVKSKKEKDLVKIFDQVDIKMKQSANNVDIKTNIDNINKLSKNFSIEINMEIRLPDCIESNLSNKYGNIVIPDFKGKLDINLQFGTLSAGIIGNSKNKIALSYAKASKITETSNIDLKLSFSELTVEETAKTTLDSKYSQLNINRVPAIEGMSRFDHLLFDEAGFVKLNCQYTQLDITTLVGFGDFVTKFGNININKIKEGFKKFDVNASYTVIKVGLEKFNGFTLDISGSYSNIVVPFETVFKQNGNSTLVKANRGNIGEINAKLSFGSFIINE